MRNTARINWDLFKEWIAETEKQPGFEWLSDDYEGWEGEDILDWDKVVEEIEAGTLSKKLMITWMEENEDRIDKTEFIEWALES